MAGCAVKGADPVETEGAVVLADPLGSDACAFFEHPQLGAASGIPQPQPTCPATGPITMRAPEVVPGVSVVVPGVGVVLVTSAGFVAGLYTELFSGKS